MKKRKEHCTTELYEPWNTSLTTQYSKKARQPSGVPQPSIALWDDDAPVAKRRYVKPGHGNAGETCGRNRVPAGTTRDYNLQKRRFRGPNPCCERLVRVDHNLRQRDLFEPFLNFQIQTKITIRRDMSRIVSQPRPRALFATNTLDNSPRLGDRLRKSSCPIQLIALRESPAIEENQSRRIFSENISRNFQHDSHAEIILLSRIFNVGVREEHGPNLVLVENCAAQFHRQRLAERALAGARKPGHKNQHCA